MPKKLSLTEIDKMEIFRGILVGISLFLAINLNSQSTVIGGLEQEILIRVEDSYNLKGIFRPAVKNERKTVILLVNAHPFSDADLSIAGSPIYKELAISLSEAGYSTLKMQSRAMTNPGVVPSEISLADMVDDLSRLLGWLKTITQNEYNIGLIAYGDNMLAALELCSKIERISFIIGLQPLVASMVYQIGMQTSQVIAQSQLPEVTKIKYEDLIYVLLRVIKNSSDPHQAAKQLNTVIDNHLHHFTEWEIEQLALSKSDRKQLLAYLNSPYMQSVLKSDVKKLYNSCPKPIACFFGEKSDSDWLSINIQSLDKYNTEREHLEIELFIEPGVGNLLSNPEHTDYKIAKKNRPMQKEVVDKIIQVIKQFEQITQSW